METISRNRCTTCNKEFENEAEQRAHYKSDWHSHNLRRKVSGVPSVTESIFNLRLQSLEAEKKSRDTKLVYTCVICNKSYGTAKAHAQHLQSRLHLSKLENGLESAPVVRPAAVRTPKPEGATPAAVSSEDEDDDDDDEWEEVAEGEIDIQSLEDGIEDMNADEAWNTAKCFICDAEPDGTLEGCLEHLHKVHGLFIPDAEFLKDPQGLVNYLGLKVTKGFACLYCEEKYFQNVDAVRKHMIAKSHCKLRYGEGEGDIDDELEEFYDFSSSYEERNGELMLVDQESLSLGAGGYELVIKGPDATKTIGTREFHRFYKQRPRPVESGAIVTRTGAVHAVVSRYRSMGLATRRFGPSVHPKETKHLPSVKLEVMRSKLGLKNNVIRNLPKNCTY